MIPKDLQWVYTLGNAFLLWGLVVYWVFCASYTYLARWWRHESGAHLFTFSLAMAIILTYVEWRVIFPARLIEPIDLYARAAIFGIEAALATWRLSILMRSQLRAYRETRDALRREVTRERRTDDRAGPGRVPTEE